MRMSSSRVTLRTLAAECGVSTATVSYALRNHPCVRAKLRKKIQETAAERGYTPNPVVSELTARLRAGRKHKVLASLAMVSLAENREDTENPTVQAWEEGCRRRAEQLGYHVDVFRCWDEGMTPKRIASILNARGIRGLVMTGPFPHAIISDDIAPLWENRAVIVMGEHPQRPAFSCVLNNQFSTALMAVTRLAELGCQRPGLCMHPHLDDILEFRFTGGYLAGLQRQSKRKPPPVFLYQQNRKTNFRAWIKTHSIDAVITLHPEIRSWLPPSGASNVLLAHLDLHSGMKDWYGVIQHNERVGLAAVDMLIGQIQRSEFGPPPFQKSVLIDGEWLEPIPKQR